MSPKAIATSAAPEILLEVHGDLRLTGSDLNEVFIETDEDSVDVVGAAPERVQVHGREDLTVRVPRRAHLLLKFAGGDARLKDLAGELKVSDVRGDLILRQVGGVTVGRVNGDLSAKRVDGPLAITSVGGDVSARAVAGEFSVDSVGGDLYLRDAGAGARGEAGGDVILNVDFVPGQRYSFAAGGDIVCRVRAGVSAKIDVESTGDISVDVPGAQVEGVDDQKTILLGAGAASVDLEAGSDVTISDVTTGTSGVADSGDDFGETLSAQIEAQINSQMAQLEKQLNEHLAHLDVNIGKRVNAEQIAARARRAAETARRKQEAIERKVEAAQRRAEHAAGRPRRGWGFNFTIPNVPTPPTPPKPPSSPPDPVSEEERMTILRLLEQGKISAADAEKLLAALEGK
jgi:hypothetical protein